MSELGEAVAAMWQPGDDCPVCGLVMVKRYDLSTGCIVHGYPQTDRKLVEGPDEEEDEESEPLLDTKLQVFPDCPKCGIQMIKRWNDEVGCAFHTDVKGDLPGHPFRGNQWTHAGENDLTTFHHNAAQNHLDRAKNALTNGSTRSALHSLIRANAHMGYHTAANNHLQAAIDAHGGIAGRIGDLGGAGVLGQAGDQSNKTAREHLMRAHQILSGHLAKDSN